MLTDRMLQKWHKEFNALVFNGELSKIKLWAGYLEPGVMGLCWGSEIAVKDTLGTEDARATLLHEMVHQWQFENDIEMDHGPTFEQWRMVCLSCTGLSL